MRFASLGSGSSGNATLVQAADTCLLIDNGFSMRELAMRAAALGVALDSIDAVLVTHEHGDHIRGVGPLARKYQMPVWMTHGTWRNARCGKIPKLSLFSSHGGPFRIGSIDIQPFAVPHDCAEPSQFVFAWRGLRLGLLTDLGSITAHVRELLQSLDGVLLECNHDVAMLRDGPYPPALQARVGGDFGHLNNQQAAQLLARIDHPGLQHIVIGHLSYKNNRPELVREALRSVCNDGLSRIWILHQHGASPWFELSSAASIGRSQS